jgi:hypothetical protein
MTLITWKKSVMSSEAQRYAEAIPLEWERLAFDKTHTAWISVQNQFIPFGNGQPRQDSINEYYTAESDWKAAQAEVKRLNIEILTTSTGW